MKPRPICTEALRWLTLDHRNRTHRAELGALTGQDRRALATFVHGLELFATADEAGQICALTAMRAAVIAMQEKTQYIAKRCIPHVLDWHDEKHIWAKIGFPPSLRVVGS